MLDARLRGHDVGVLQVWRGENDSLPLCVLLTAALYAVERGTTAPYPGLQCEKAAIQLFSGESQALEKQEPDSRRRGSDGTETFRCCPGQQCACAG